MPTLMTFGRQPTSAPKGTSREIHFPEMAELDTGTNEGDISRIVTSDGAEAISLPRTIWFQKQQFPGHSQAVAVGAIHEYTVDGTTGKMSGKGWLIDNEHGREAAQYVIAQALHHNSVDLREVTVRIVENGESFWSEDWHADIFFDKWKLDGSTLVGGPAFRDAHGIIPDDEMTAAMSDTSPLVVTCPSVIGISLAETEEELTASAAGLPDWGLFHEPEPDTHRKLTVGIPREDGFIPISGHLALWETCHDGIDARCTRVPRPKDNYASFNVPGVLTDRGIVECGPITLFGGHVPLEKAFDDPANAWADVRVTPGKFGPWCSGIVRPGVALDDAKVYVARASRISGHWKGSRLKAIVACNVPAFDVPGSGFSFTTNALGEVDELVASYPACAEAPDSPLGQARAEDVVEAAGVIRTFTTTNVPKALLSFAEMSPASQKQVKTWLQQQLDNNGTTITTSDTITTEITVEIDEDVDLIIETDGEFDIDIERARRERQLALEAEVQ